MFSVKWSYGKQRRRSEDAVKMHIEEIHFDDQRCLHIVCGKIRGFIFIGFQTSVSVIAVRIMLYVHVCAEGL